MNKEQIDEIALRVASEIPCCCNHLTIEEGVAWSADEVKSYTHALLAELAKVSEPVARLIHRKFDTLQDTCRTVARTYEECDKNAYPDSWEEGALLYTHPLPQPDLVAENEHKEWALLMNADIEQLRKQLSAAQQDLGLCKLTLEQKVEQLGHCESALAAAQADNEEWVTVLEVAAEQIRRCNYTPARSTLLQAIAAHKARKDGNEST